MDLDSYISQIDTLIQAIEKVAGPTGCTLRIRKVATIHSGVFASDLVGDVHAPAGYSLLVRKEYLRIELDGSIHRQYRYTILRGSDELIRMQTDLRHPENAHFPPNYLSEDGKHFTIDRWPDYLQDMNFLTMYKFFRSVIRADGELPEPFKSAK